MAMNFGFTDLHSFKDYVGFVKLCSPDDFPTEEWAEPGDRWTLDLAFDGLRLGLRMAAEEKGKRNEFLQGESLVEDAHAAYRDGRVRNGFFKLEELQNLLKSVPSQ
jgi:hypothetical protein